MLSAAATRALSAGDAAGLLQAVFATSMTEFGLRACFCHVLDGPAMRLAAHVGLTVEAVAALEAPAPDSLYARVAAAGHGMRVDATDTPAASPPDPGVSQLFADGLRTVACRPVMIDEQCVATITFCARRAEALGRREVGWLGTVCDLVGAAKRRLAAEAELTSRIDAERATNEQILQQLPSPLLLADGRTGEIVFANLAAEQLLGTLLPSTASDLDGWLSRPTPTSFAPETLPLARALAGETVTGAQLRLPAGRGGEAGAWPLSLEVNAAPLRDADGQVRYAVMACADLTEQKRAEAAMRVLAATLEAKVAERTAEVRRSEARLQALVDASAQIVWAADGTGRVVEDSPSWRAFTGQSREEWLDNRGPDAIHPDDRVGFQRAWSSALSRAAAFEMELRLHHAATDSWRWTHLRAVPLPEPGGGVREWVGMFADVHARREAEADRERLARELLVAAQQERQRISRILHDDLQQILYGVLLKVRQLSRELGQEQTTGAMAVVDEVRSWVQGAVDTTRRLTASLSPSLLEERGLADALAWLAERMRDLHGLSVTVHADTDAAPSESQISVALLEIARELLFNVAKHAGVDRAEVRLGRSGGDVQLEVIDSGRGFPASGASGFGLTSVRERLRLLGGELEIVSPPGGGTRVSVHAPMQARGTP
ncbi:MAG: PAS domain-containing protein [Myxococcota bacterium]